MIDPPLFDSTLSRAMIPDRRQPTYPQTDGIGKHIVLWYSTVIAMGLVALVWSADRFVDGASAIAKRAGLTPMLIGLTIVSVGTSAPEILISIMSALADSRARRRQCVGIQHRQRRAGIGCYSFVE